MAKKRLSASDIDRIVNQYLDGESIANLAFLFNVHYTTIYRQLKSMKVLSPAREAHVTKLNKNSRNLLIRILSKYGISNIDQLVMELDRHFIFKERDEEDEEFKVIHLEE